MISALSMQGLMTSPICSSTYAAGWKTATVPLSTCIMFGATTLMTIRAPAQFFTSFRCQSLAPIQVLAAAVMSAAQPAALASTQYVIGSGGSHQTQLVSTSAWAVDWRSAA